MDTLWRGVHIAGIVWEHVPAVRRFVPEIIGVSFRNIMDYLAGRILGTSVMEAIENKTSPTEENADNKQEETDKDLNEKKIENTADEQAGVAGENIAKDKTDVEAEVNGENEADGKTDDKAENKANDKIDPKADLKIDIKAEDKVENKANNKSDAKPFWNILHFRANDKTNVAADVNAESKADVKAYEKVDLKIDDKTENIANDKTDVKAEVKEEDKAENKANNKTDAKADLNIDIKHGDKVENKAGNKSDAKPFWHILHFRTNDKGDVEANVNAENKAESKAYVKVDVKIDDKAENIANDKTDVKAEARVDDKAENKSNDKTDVKTDLKDDSKLIDKVGDKADVKPFWNILNFRANDKIDDKSVVTAVPKTAAYVDVRDDDKPNAKTIDETKVNVSYKPDDVDDETISKDESEDAEVETEEGDGYIVLEAPADMPPDTTTTATLAERDDYMYYFEDELRKSVTKSHYIPKEERTKCQACSVPFSFLQFNRARHCRRCGDVFCRSCLMYRRRLNVWAQPDNKGILCKVCGKCYGETEVVLFGIKRSLTEYFTSLRQQCKTEKRHILCDITIEKRNGSVVPAFWREEFEVDIPRECERLVKGFKTAVGSSEAYKTLHEMTDKFIVPSWQKAKYWTLESSVLKCRICEAQIKGKKYRNCRVCALALCRKCSLKELLVYFEDGRPSQRDTNPKLAIIKVVGSPEVEPRYSLRMNICKYCRNDLVERQIADPNWLANISKPPDPDLMSRILDVDQNFRDLIAEIHQDVERLWELGVTRTTKCRTEAVAGTTADDKDEQSTKSSKDNASSSLDVKTLKERVQDSLDRYYRVFQALEKSVADLMKSANGRKLKLAKNYIQARRHSYNQLKTRASLHNSD